MSITSKSLLNKVRVLLSNISNDPSYYYIRSEGYKIKRILEAKVYFNDKPEPKFGVFQTRDGLKIKRV